MRILGYIVMVLAALTFAALAWGQVQIPRKPVVRFTYDAAGNIASRTVTYEYPDWDYQMDSCAVDTGVIAYPNPTVGPLSAQALNYSGEFPLRYEIYNENGALVRSVSSMTEVTDVSLGDHVMGNYVLKALRGDSVIAIKILKVN